MSQVRLAQASRKEKLQAAELEKAKRAEAHRRKIAEREEALQRRRAAMHEHPEAAVLDAFGTAAAVNSRAAGVNSMQSLKGKKCKQGRAEAQSKGGKGGKGKQGKQGGDGNKGAGGARGRRKHKVSLRARLRIPNTKVRPGIIPCTAVAVQTCSLCARFVGAGWRVLGDR